MGARAKKRVQTERVACGVDDPRLACYSRAHRVKLVVMRLPLEDDIQMGIILGGRCCVGAPRCVAPADGYEWRVFVRLHIDARGGRRGQYVDIEEKLGGASCVELVFYPYKLLPDGYSHNDVTLNTPCLAASELRDTQRRYAKTGKRRFRRCLLKKCFNQRRFVVKVAIWRNACNPTAFLYSRRSHVLATQPQPPSPSFRLFCAACSSLGAVRLLDPVLDVIPHVFLVLLLSCLVRWWCVPKLLKHAVPPLIILFFFWSFLCVSSHLGDRDVDGPGVGRPRTGKLRP